MPTPQDIATLTPKPDEIDLLNKLRTGGFPFLLTRFINETKGFKYVIDVKDADGVTEVQKVLGNRGLPKDVIIRNQGTPVVTPAKLQGIHGITSYLSDLPFREEHMLSNKFLSYVQEVGQYGKNFIDFERIYNEPTNPDINGANIGKICVSEDIKVSAEDLDFFQEIFKNTRVDVNEIRANIAKSIIGLNAPRKEEGLDENTEKFGVEEDWYQSAKVIDSGGNTKTGAQGKDLFANIKDNINSILKQEEEVKKEWFPDKKTIVIPSLSICIGPSGEDKIVPPTIFDTLNEVTTIKGLKCCTSMNAEEWGQLDPDDKKDALVKIWIVRSLDAKKYKTLVQKTFGRLFAGTSLGHDTMAGITQNLTGSRVSAAAGSLGFANYSASHAVGYIEVPRLVDGGVFSSDFYPIGYGYANSVADNNLYRDLNGGGLKRSLQRALYGTSNVLSKIVQLPFGLGVQGASRILPKVIKERLHQNLTGTIYAPDPVISEKMDKQREKSIDNVKKVKKDSEIRKKWDELPFFEIVGVYNMPSKVKTDVVATLKEITGKEGYYIEIPELKIIKCGKKIEIHFNPATNFIDRNSQYSTFSNTTTSCSNCATFATRVFGSVVNCASPFATSPTQCMTTSNGREFEITDDYTLGATPYGSYIIGQKWWHQGGTTAGGGQSGGDDTCDSLINKIIYTSQYLNLLYKIIEGDLAHIIDSHAKQTVRCPDKLTSVKLDEINTYKDIITENSRAEGNNGLVECLNKIDIPTNSLNKINSDICSTQSQSQGQLVLISIYDLIKEISLNYDNLKGDNKKYKEGVEKAWEEGDMNHDIELQDLLRDDKIQMLIKSDFFIKDGELGDIFGTNPCPDDIEGGEEMGEVKEEKEQKKEGGGRKNTRRKRRRKRKRTKRSKPNKKKRTKKHHKKRKYTKSRR